jgi:hypothetical protein
MAGLRLSEAFQAGKDFQKEFKITENHWRYIYVTTVEAA